MDPPTQPFKFDVYSHSPICMGKFYIFLYDSYLPKFTFNLYMGSNPSCSLFIFFFVFMGIFFFVYLLHAQLELTRCGMRLRSHPWSVSSWMPLVFAFCFSLDIKNLVGQVTYFLLFLSGKFQNQKIYRKTALCGNYPDESLHYVLIVLCHCDRLWNLS